MSKITLGIRRQSWSFLLSISAHSGLVALLFHASFNSALKLSYAKKPISVVMGTSEDKKENFAPLMIKSEAQIMPIKQLKHKSLALTEPKMITKPEPVKKKTTQSKIKQKKINQKQFASSFTSKNDRKIYNNATVHHSSPVSNSTKFLRPNPLSRTKPQYPARAFSLGVEGRATLQFNVDSKGRVGNIRVLTAQPPNIFERDIRHAMKKWRYETGKPGKDLQVTIIFKINDNSIST